MKKLIDFSSLRDGQYYDPKKDEINRDYYQDEFSKNLNLNEGDDDNEENKNLI